MSLHLWYLYIFMSSIDTFARVAEWNNAPTTVWKHVRRAKGIQVSLSWIFRKAVGTFGDNFNILSASGKDHHAYFPCQWYPMTTDVDFFLCHFHQHSPFEIGLDRFGDLRVGPSHCSQHRLCIQSSPPSDLMRRRCFSRFARLAFSLEWLPMDTASICINRSTKPVAFQELPGPCFTMFWATCFLVDSAKLQSVEVATHSHSHEPGEKVRHSIWWAHWTNTKVGSDLGTCMGWGRRPSCGEVPAAKSESMNNHE